MEYINQGPTVCEVCNTAPQKEPDGIRCKCSGKGWHEPGPVRADPETEALIRQKGFMLAGCGWYYYSHSSLLLTIFSNGSWQLDYTEQPAITNLKEFLLSLPDGPVPAQSST